MSDAPQGYGWWQADDDRWYSPEQHPNYRPGPPTPRVPAATMNLAIDQAQTPLPVLMVAGGGLGMLIGSFLPWLKATLPFIGSISRSGVDGGGDGLITAGIGGLLCLLGCATAFKRPGPGAKIALIGLSVTAFLLMIYEYRNVSNHISGVDSEYRHLIEVGAGLYLTMASAILAIVGSSLLTTRVDEALVQRDRPLTHRPLPPAALSAWLVALMAGIVVIGYLVANR